MRYCPNRPCLLQLENYRGHDDGERPGKTESTPKNCSTLMTPATRREASRQEGAQARRDLLLRGLEGPVVRAEERVEADCRMDLPETPGIAASTMECTPCGTARRQRRRTLNTTVTP